MLINFLSENKSISFHGRVAQMLLFASFGSKESFILVTMAYDYYAAIYSPLLYALNMSCRVYVQQITAPYVSDMSHAMVHTVIMLSPSFCGSNEIIHIF